jgi:hypothetical protein
LPLGEPASRQSRGIRVLGPVRRKAEALRRRTLAELKVHTMAPPGGSHGEGLHWFRIEFDDAEGRCFITSDEAQRLRQLTTGWVTRTLEILVRQRGWPWLRKAAAGSSGLMLHCSDAGEFARASSASHRSRRQSSIAGRALTPIGRRVRNQRARDPSWFLATHRALGARGRPSCRRGDLSQ